MQAFRDQLTEQGLNLFAVAKASDYDANMPKGLCSNEVLPGSQSILVVASGGQALWRGFLASLEREPRHLVDEPHPIDAYVKRCVAQADALLEAGQRRWLFAEAEPEAFVDFRLLARLANLGLRSRLGLLLHDTYGPWLGLRAACFMEDRLEPTPPSPGAGCTGCPSPCISACPAGALNIGQWDVEICSQFHSDSDLCDSTCHARTACPVGETHRYSPHQIQYHYNRHAGRQWLRRHFHIKASADPHEGVGPHWGLWKG